MYPFCMRKQYSLFQSHLDLAHHYWKHLIHPGDIVIDATCGNGHDTLELCRLTLNSTAGQVYALDIQQDALKTTQKRLTEHLLPDQLARVQIRLGCHSQFPPDIAPQSVRLIVYNLGYLPGGQKKTTTMTETTLQSLKQAQDLILPGGAISVTCYPGHPQGQEEELAIIEYLSSFRPQEWSCCHHRWLNRQQAPSLLLIQKSII